MDRTFPLIAVEVGAAFQRRGNARWLGSPGTLSPRRVVSLELQRLVVGAVFAVTAREICFDAAYGVKVVHGVEPLAEAAQRHRDLDDMRELPLNRFGAWTTFVAHEVRW